MIPALTNRALVLQSSVFLCHSEGSLDWMQWCFFFFRDVSMRVKNRTDLKLSNDVWFDLLRNFQKKCSAF